MYEMYSLYEDLNIAADIKIRKLGWRGSYHKEGRCKCPQK